MKDRDPVFIYSDEITETIGVNEVIKGNKRHSVPENSYIWGRQFNGLNCVLKDMFKS